MKQKTGRKLLSFLLALVMVVGLMPSMSLTAYAETSNTGIEVLITDIDCEHYKDKTTSFTTDDGLANISFSTTPSFHEWYGWYNPNGELTITVTAANGGYPISKCVFQCCGEGREDSTAPFEVTISHGGNWQNTTATINGVTESSGGLRNIGFFSLVTPDYTVLKDGMLIKPGESIIPGDYYYKTAERVNIDNKDMADFKQNTLYTLVKGNIESRQVDPSYPDWVEDVFVESSDGNHYAFLQVATKQYIFDEAWTITNHADGLLVSQGTSENMNNPEERITTYAFSVHEKVFNDVTVDSTIENGSIEIKDSKGTAISEAEAGSTVTLDVSANTGYKLKEISANYLEVQSVSELMELIGSGKCYENPSNLEESNYFEVVDNSIKVFAWMQGEYLYSLPSTVELDKTRSSEGIYTAIGTYTYDDAPLTWIFKVKNGKIISIGFDRNGADWGIVNIESTGAIAEPKYASVELTPVTTGKRYTFTMPATDVTVHATFASKEASVVTKAPEAKTLTYNGSAQELVTAGTATGGEMQYALGNATEATQPYTTSIPTGTTAGTYYVWYKVKGDDNHNDVDPKCVTAVISDPSPMVTTSASVLLRTMTVNWTKDKSVKNYKVAYRKAGSSKWTIKKTSQPGYVVWNHRTRDCYEYKVAAVINKKDIWSDVDCRYFNTVSTKAKAGKGTITVSWCKDSKSSGYQIMVATNKNMNDAQIINAASSKKSYVVSGLKKGKTYYVRVRPMKLCGDVQYVGILSNTCKVKVK